MPRTLLLTIPPRIPGGRLLALLAASTLIGACQSTSDTESPSSPDASATAAAPGATDTADLDQRYVIGPSVAREMGYRIDWQVRALSSAESLRSVVPQHDSLFVVDSENFLARFQRKDGRRVWRVSVAEPWEEILGVNYVPFQERVYITTGGSVRVVDAITGSTIARQALSKVASTAPVLFNIYFIYGGRNGQLIWYAPQVAYDWQAYQVSQSLTMRPLLDGNVVMAVGNDGRVMALNAETATQLWSKQLLDSVVAHPVSGNGIVYLAATDQYLYAFDLVSGRTLWRRLTTSPLVDSPTLIGNRVYQQIPGAGLTSFDAIPLDDPDGVIVWTASNVDGNVLTQRRQDLLAWDGADRSITLVNGASGGVVHNASVPQVQQLMATSVREGNLFAVADDGRIERLVPRN
ncbi:MAG: outer membrane protein assembly factor BamB family protein [Planctomycetota bacterium]